jgi:hypothetical protein
MSLASLKDWAIDLAAMLAEVYCLPVNISQALADDIAEILEKANLRPRPGEPPPLLSVLEQSTFNASYERMARAEQVGQGIVAGGLTGESRHYLHSEVWAGFACACLALSYDISPSVLLYLVSGLSKVFDAYEIPQRPVQVLSAALLKDLPVDPRTLRAGASTENASKATNTSHKSEKKHAPVKRGA